MGLKFIRFSKKKLWLALGSVFAGVKYRDAAKATPESLWLKHLENAKEFFVVA